VIGRVEELIFVADDGFARDRIEWANRSERTPTEQHSKEDKDAQGNPAGRRRQFHTLIFRHIKPMISLNIYAIPNFYSNYLKDNQLQSLCQPMNVICAGSRRSIVHFAAP
ncbi:MAG: hypothetical protein J0M07_26350, partial [Anaerolineae bacterium]|nr:hypothetical protein [Anaerolineae bacterium]